MFSTVRPKKRILITGASGFLGTSLYNGLSRDPENIVLGTCFLQTASSLPRLDITDPTAVRGIVGSFRPDVVVHTVALSDPDECERRRSSAEEINFLGTRYLAQACEETGARLDYVSTVYVFDGRQGNYVESDAPNPVNWYGETKLRAEREVMGLSDFGIYRFDKLYGYNGAKKSNDLYSALEVGKTAKANDKQVRQPLFAPDFECALRMLWEHSAQGIFHLAGPEKMTKYELARRLATLIGREHLVVAVEEKHQEAKRPYNTSLSTERIRTLGMHFTPLAKALELIKATLLDGNLANFPSSAEVSNETGDPRK